MVCSTSNKCSRCSEEVQNGQPGEALWRADLHWTPAGDVEMKENKWRAFQAGEPHEKSYRGRGEGQTWESRESQS